MAEQEGNIVAAGEITESAAQGSIYEQSQTLYRETGVFLFPGDLHLRDHPDFNGVVVGTHEVVYEFSPACGITANIRPKIERV